MSAPTGNGWIACVMNEVRGDRQPIFTRGAPLLFALVGVDHLRYALNGNQLEVYVYQPRLIPKAPTWVRPEDLRGRR